MGRRYLIIKTSALGDVVQTLPVASYLKATEPDCLIDWVVEKGAANLLRACPLLNHVIEVDTKKWRSHPFSSWNEMLNLRRQLQQCHYDVVFDLQGNTKSALIAYFTNSPIKAGFGKNCVPESPNLLFTNRKIELPEGLNIRDDYLWVVSNVLDRPLPNDMPPIVLNVDSIEAAYVKTLHKLNTSATLLAPGSAWENKRLSKEQLIELISTIPKDDHLFLSWGSETERTFCESLVLHHPHATVLPKLSLPALQLLMSKMRLVISMDSLPLHLAATTGVATYSFFGPSNAQKYAPKGVQHSHIQGECPYGKIFSKRCPILRTCPTGACIKNL